ncbi:MAG: serine hydrolase [Bergeyella sp.]|nr:serine hydrolase [Bergeyella sp.]
MKVLKILLVVTASGIALSYILGLGYIYRALYYTYFRGETTATIDDGKFFPKNVITAINPVPWQKDTLYNTLKLPKALERSLRKNKTISFLVIKDGKLLLERYWGNYNKDSLTNSFSMAKGVTALLLGAAIDDKLIISENELFSNFYESYAQVKYGKELTLKDLVTMEAGLDWKEEYYSPFSPNTKAYYGKSLAETVFLRGFKQPPGKTFEYQSGATQLLGFALRKSVNKPLAYYTAEKLWNPLGMEKSASWATDDNRMEKTFCCIQAVARDYAKLGQLMLNKGKSGGKQVINENYINKMITPTRASRGAYGYGLWINNDVENKHYYFLGFLGQFVIVVPEQNLVIVRTGKSFDEKKDDKERPVFARFMADQVVDFINSVYKNGL